MIASALSREAAGMRPRERAVPPRGLGFCIQKSPGAGAERLFPEERAALGERNAPSRERDFIRGRMAAHQALRRIGRDPEPILRGGRNEPLWPSGVVGSIAHSQGTAISAVAWERHASGIGVDIESARAAITDEMAGHILSPPEADLLQGMEAESLARVIAFSAKESVFKAFYRHHRDYFGFREVEFIRRARNQITGRLLFPIPGAFRLHYEFSVRYILAGGMVLTYLVLPPLEA